MDRALALAMRGRGAVEPNPMVGCVIARGARILGEGYHERFGGPHAEPNALAACSEPPAGATAYVTLEPCCHTNKKTPPCVPRLIEAKLARVVIGTLDPNPRVAGRGAEQLRAAGIEVNVLNLPAARQLIAPFIARIVHARPYVTLKWAESADRKVAGPMGRRAQISNDLATRAVHEMRARCDAILVGINTALCDDPMLTARRATPMRPLTRIVVDGSLRLPPSSRLVTTAQEAKVIVYTSESASSAAPEKRRRLEAAGVEVRAIPEETAERLSLEGIITDIGRREVTHLLVEPGPTLARSFMDGQPALWDRAWVFQSPKRIDDPTAPDAPPLPTIGVAQMLLGSDRLTEYINPASNVMFAPVPSADFVLTNQ